MKSLNEKDLKNPCSKKFGICFFVLTLFVIGFLLVNAYYVPGKETTIKTWVEQPVLNTTGYTQVGTYSDYVVTGIDENGNEVEPHAQIEAEKCSEIVIAMQAKAKNDSDISLKIYKDETRNEQTDEVRSVWKKGSSLIRLTGIKATGDVYDLYVPTNFKLDCIYYANEIDGSSFKEKKQTGYVVALILSIVIGVLTGLNKRLRCILNRAKNCVISKCKRIKNICINNKKTVIKFIAGIFGSFIIAVLIDLGLSNVNFVPFQFMFVYFFFSIIFFVYFVFVFKEWLTKHIELTTCILMILFGSMMVVVKIPTTEVLPDDHTHYSNQYMSVKDICPYTSAADLRLIALEPKNPIYDTKEVRDSLIEQIDYVDKIGYSYKIKLVGNYIGKRQPGVRIAYIPNRIGLWLGNALGLKYHHRFIMGCLGNFVFYLILVLISLKKLRYGKYTLMLVSLIPIYIFQATGYTYDVWVLGLYTLGFSIFMGRWQQSGTKAKTSELVMICLLMFLFYQPKLVYFFAVFILLFLQSDKFKNNKQKYIYRVMLILIMLAPIMPMLMVRVIRPFTEINMATADKTIHSEMVSGLQYVKSNPLRFLKEWIGYILRYANPFTKDYGFFMRFGYYGKSGVDWLISLALIISAFIENPKEDKNKYPVIMKIVSFLIYIGVIAICTLVMFLEEGRFSSYCGRYILPVLFPTLFMLTRVDGPIKDKMSAVRDQIQIKAIPAIPVFLIGICMFTTTIILIIKPYLGS